MLSELRQLQLKKLQAPEKVLGEAKDFYRFMDSGLSGISFKSDGSLWEGEERLREVMTAAHFNNAFGDFIDRLLLPAYQKKNFDFEQFIRPRTVPNFAEVSDKQRRAGVDDLEYVGEKGEAQAGYYPDATKRNYAVHIWEKQFDFSMKALVNDDLGYFEEVVPEMGYAARRTLEKFVSRMMWNALTTGWLLANAPLYSTLGRLTSTRIATARMAFNQRTDARGEPIMATLKFLVHHAGLVDAVRVIRQSQLIPELATNAANVIAGDFVPIEDPYCAGVAPNLPWYGMVDFRANNIIPFTLARRRGVPGPQVWRLKSNIESVSSLLGAGRDVGAIWGDFATGNIVVKVHDEWGTYIDPSTVVGTSAGNMFDVRGSYYAQGTMP